jgi:hypothetical protein
VEAGAEDRKKNRGQREQKQPADLALAFHAVAEVDKVVGSGGAGFRLNGWGSYGHKAFT